MRPQFARLTRLFLGGFYSVPGVRVQRWALWSLC